MKAISDKAVEVIKVVAIVRSVELYLLQFQVTSVLALKIECEQAIDILPALIMTPIHVGLL